MGFWFTPSRKLIGICMPILSFIWNPGEKNWCFASPYPTYRGRRLLIPEPCAARTAALEPPGKGLRRVPESMAGVREQIVDSDNEAGSLTTLKACIAGWTLLPEYAILAHANDRLDHPVSNDGPQVAERWNALVLYPDAGSKRALLIVTRVSVHAVGRGVAPSTGMCEPKPAKPNYIDFRIKPEVCPLRG